MRKHVWGWQSISTSIAWMTYIQVNMSAWTCSMYWKCLGWIRFHSFGLKLSRNSIISLESFIIRPDFIHIWAQRKPLALERGWGYSLNEQWLAILPSYIDIDQWISALTLVIYYHGSRKYKRTSHYFRYCKLDYSIFFGGDEEQKWEDEIILRSNDKKRRRNYLVPSKVQVHNLNSKSWTCWWIFRHISCH